MMHPKALSILDYTYQLPEDRIAKYPLAERDMSKLLVYRNGNITASVYHQLDSHLPAGSFLLFNNTKVVEARLLFQKPTGGAIELFCLEPHEQYPDITTAMLQKGNVLWKCLVGGAKKWKEGTLVQTIEKEGHQIQLSAVKTGHAGETYTIAFGWNNDQLSFAEILHLAGVVPLPPYINRPAEEGDRERYQTIYAQYDGSVAAPTAGLHFTGRVFDALKAKNINTHFVTLHVGAGTFKPVKSSTMQGHEMHAEFIDVSIELVEALLNRLSAPVITVGTTSLRTAETLYWLGVKAKLNPGINAHDLHITQWEAYELPAGLISAAEALEALLQWMRSQGLQQLITKTQIIIAPGYRFRIIDALVTNFHQPQSTLLLLVAALTGKDWKKIYNYALDNAFRFLSYGDGCLLWKGEESS